MSHQEFSRYVSVVTNPANHNNRVCGEKRTTFERTREVSQIITQINADSCEEIFQWIADPATQKHLSTVPPTVTELETYYTIQPEEIIPLVAINEFGDPIGVLSIRTQDSYISSESCHIAGIERLIVHPEMKRHGIATQLLKRALEIIFEERDYNEVRVWIMTDDIAGDWTPNFNLFTQKLHFQPVPGDDVFWADYKARRNLLTDPSDHGRNAMWLFLTKERWEKKQQSAHPHEKNPI